MATAQQAPPETPEQTIAGFRELLATGWITYAVHAAASLGIADVATDHPRSSTDIAADVHGDPAAVDRLLRGLVTLGLFEAYDDGYALTAMGALLRADTPLSQRGRVLLQFGAPARRSWGVLEECIRTGAAAPKVLDDQDDPFASLTSSPAAAAQFDGAMAEATRQLAGAIAQAYDFAGIDRLVDVGGGYGTLLSTVLASHPGLSGVVFDQPHCRDGAEQQIAAAGLSDRYEFAAGDFFEDPLPSGADAYILKSVLHDWDDNRALAILRRCRGAMPERSRLLVIEVVVPDRLGSTATHRGMVFADLHMMVATGGRERSASQYRDLLHQSDFAVTRVIPTGTPAGLDVIEATPRGT